MIELHRARLLAAGKGGRSGDGQNGSQPVASLAAAKTPAAAQVKQTPQEAAASAVQTEDVQLDRFLQRLQDRDDSRPASASGPTVPTALARRMLQKQGVGFLDSTVAAVASAAADRFLATVLQQAVACRVQRLEGAEVTRQAAMARKRHMQQVEADADDRKRRRAERLRNKEKANLADISAAEALKKTGASPLKDGEGSTAKSKKKKKPDTETTTVNGNRLKHDQDDDEDSYDSLDEEEEYYKQYYGEASGDVDEDEEEDDALIIMDIARPLEAWDFHVTGKHGLISTAKEEDEEEDVAMDDEEELEGPAADQNQDQFDDDDGDDDSADDMTTKTASSTGKSGKTKSPQDKKRKATSPVPPSANSPTPSNKD